MVRHKSPGEIKQLLAECKQGIKDLEAMGRLSNPSFYSDLCKVINDLYTVILDTMVRVNEMEKHIEKYESNK
jgi:hypothetical protein